MKRDHENLSIPENTLETKTLLNEMSLEQRQLVLDTIKKCGCVCHYTKCLHFRECCDFTYVKIFDPTQSS